MKKFLSVFLAAATAFSLSACGGKDDSSVADEMTAAKAKERNTPFGQYVSNTPVATGNNYIVKSTENTTYRAYFPVEEYGEFDYCFYFSNEVDSTYDSGSNAYIGMKTGDYQIASAFIADGGSGPEDEITNRQAVTFDSGKTSKDVKSGEDFWSDPVKFNVPDGHYLVWEWTLTGENIPCTYMSNLTSSTADVGGYGTFGYCDQIPLPQLIGCSRDVKYTVSAIGDSITQGCQTEFMAYEFWAAQVSKALGKDYSFWNCGLGWSRTSDIASKGNWLERAKNSDIVLVSFGTNDIISGEYGGDGGNSPDEIDAYLKTVLDELKASDCTIIVFNAPPQNFEDDLEKIRTEYNEKLKDTCKEYDAYYFDFASLLGDENDASKAKYGAHPEGEAGKLIADEFIKEYKKLFDLK